MGHINYAFIDESGDLGRYGSKYFSIAALITEEPETLARIIKKLRQRKLKKKLKQLPEIKANNSNYIIRKYVLKKVSLSNCKIFAVVVDKSKIFDHLYNVKDKLYNYLCGQLLSRVELSCNKFIVIVDKKHTNTLIRKDFNKYIKSKLNQISKELEVEIYHLPSYSKNELQVADFVVWSINRKFNWKDDTYYKLFETKIVNRNNLLLWK